MPAWGIRTTRFFRPLRAPTSKAPFCGHRSPPRVCDVRETPLCLGRDGANIGVDLNSVNTNFYSCKKEFFCLRSLTRRKSTDQVICPSGRASPLPLWERESAERSSATGEGLSPQIQCLRIETPHSALRATFSHKGRRNLTSPGTRASSGRAAA